MTPIRPLPPLMRIVPERLSSPSADTRRVPGPHPAPPKIRSFLIGLLGLASALALLWGVELLRRQDPFARLARTIAQSGLQHIELRLEDATLTLREGNRVQAKLQVDRIDIEKSRILWRAVNLREGVFYDEEGKLLGRASAGEIIYNQPMRQLHITGTPTMTLFRNPLVENAVPLTIRAPMLLWDLRTARITIEHPFTLEWHGGSARAERLLLNLRESLLRIEKGTMHLQSDKQNNRREVRIQYDEFEYRDDLRRVKNLRLQDDDTTAFAPYAEVDNKRKYAIATGELWLEDPRLNLKANKLEVWYAENQKRALLTQNVRLLIKPRQATNQPAEKEEEDKLQEAKRYPVEAECGQIEYFYRKKRAIITGGIKAIQRLKEGQERTLTADRAEYDQKNEILVLIGNVVLEDPDGKFKAPRLIVSVKEGEEWVRAPEGGEGILYYTEEEEGGESTPPR